MVYYRLAWYFWVSSCKIHCATGWTFPHSLALKKTILMRSVLASSILLFWNLFTISSPKVWEKFPKKKAFHVGQTFFGQT